ncbi:bifunctional folylpolyglutamate synthase/dihydrofolate synthase [candidate division KSB1 bacterium]|nr:bifunctional folylpolyglutamate synthase/dihydrofolate synthase [candidate division KSB1 bacterium]
MDNYSLAEAVDFLYSRQSYGWKLGLDRMETLLHREDDPHRAFSSFLIAGTNGKGSTAAMLASIFQKSDKRVGLYTSPHLFDIRERIRINGEKVDPAVFTSAVARFRPTIIEYGCTFFEAVTAVAFECFRCQSVEVAILEVGLGGRLDATNVVDSEISIITDISKDHVQHLGQELRDIAFEKAGIIKEKKPCVVGRLNTAARAVIDSVCTSRQSERISVREMCRVSALQSAPHMSVFRVACGTDFRAKIRLPLGGVHQVGNSLVALTAARRFAVQRGYPSDSQIVSGLEEVYWPCRFEQVTEKPRVIFDVAHNPGSIQRLCRGLKRFYSNSSIVVIFGVLADKDYVTMLQSLARLAEHIFLVPIDHPRALRVDESFAICRELGLPSTRKVNYQQAYWAAANFPVKKEPRTICVTGSHFLIAQTGPVHSFNPF